MRNIKKIVSLFMIMGLCIGMCSSHVSASTKYGFTYDTNAYNVSWKSLNSFNVYTEGGGRLGTCSYVVGLTREKGTNNYVLMAREVMSPNKSKVPRDELRYGYGFSEYVSVKVTLPSLDDYEPQNEPSSNTVDFSIGRDSSGYSIEASYTITKSDLDIQPSCDTPSKLYYVTYDYKPHIVIALENNSYLAYESIQLGAAAFESSKETISFTMNYDARFGAAGNEQASPWLVYPGYVRKATTSRSYNFTVNKN